MKNIIKIFIITLCLSATACTNNNSSTDSVKTDSSTIEISTSSNVDSIEIDSSNESSEIDSSSISETDSSNESSEVDSEDESSKAVTTTKETAKATTTKAVYKETDKATTTTKQTTTQPAVTTKPYVAPITTTQKPVVTTKPAVQTTKTTTKATTKQTTKATTKATSKSQADVILAKLPDYKQAIGRILIGKQTANDWEIIRKHYLDYGQKLAPNYVQDKTLTYFIDPKTGKGTNDWKSYFNPQNPPNAPITCQEPLPIHSGINYQFIGWDNLSSDIESVDTDLKRIIYQGLNFYNWREADKGSLVWYIQFGCVCGGNEVNILCITASRHR